MNQYIAHTGVKGMKWGVRKAPEKGTARDLNARTADAKTAYRSERDAAKKAYRKRKKTGFTNRMEKREAKQNRRNTTRNAYQRQAGRITDAYADRGAKLRTKKAAQTKQLGKALLGAGTLQATLAGTRYISNPVVRSATALGGGIVSGLLMGTALRDSMAININDNRQNHK